MIDVTIINFFVDTINRSLIKCPWTILNTLPLTTPLWTIQSPSKCIHLEKLCGSRLQRKTSNFPQFPNIHSYSCEKICYELPNTRAKRAASFGWGYRKPLSIPSTLSFLFFLWNLISHNNQKSQHLRRHQDLITPPNLFTKLAPVKHSALGFQGKLINGSLINWTHPQIVPFRDQALIL